LLFAAWKNSSRLRIGQCEYSIYVLKGYEMIRRAIWLLIVLFSVIVSTAQDKPEAKDPATRWEKTIRTFEDWDRKNTFPSDAVLFVGSSSIRMWPTRECFEEFAVINRGFGGSQISDVNYYAKRIVLCYKPKVVVFYAGDNDIAAGESDKQVFDDYKAFTKLVHQKQPNTRIIFISIKPSGSRWSLWPVMSRANMMIKNFSDTDRRLFYFDAATPLLDNEGQPNLDLFLGDKLHLNSKGYEIWTKLLRPIIKGASKPQKR
ncbi:GDSL-type esterase/lipase family protein, partial [Planctomycetota bacterium]